MARWKYTLDLKDVWKKAKNEEISCKELADEIAKRIKNLPCYETDSKLQDICTEFEFFDEEGEADELDFIMSDLYDWGDEETNPKGRWPRNAKCWIKTEF